MTDPGTSVAKATTDRLESRREQLLQAAIACFARDGFHQTTMADIASEAGITAAAIYRYFPSKEDIVDASARARRQDRAARFLPAQQTDDAAQALEEVLTAYWERLVQPDDSILLDVQLLSEALRSPRVRASVLTSWDDVTRRLEEIIQRGQADGKIDPDLEPNATARLFVAAFIGTLIQKALDPDVDVLRSAAVLKSLYRNRGASAARRTVSSGRAVGSQDCVEEGDHGGR